jgi:hypothetical protein
MLERYLCVARGEPEVHSRLSLRLLMTKCVMFKRLNSQTCGLYLKLKQQLTSSQIMEKGGKSVQIQLIQQPHVAFMTRLELEGAQAATRN